MASLLSSADLFLEVVAVLMLVHPFNSLSDVIVYTK